MNTDITIVEQFILGEHRVRIFNKTYGATFTYNLKNELTDFRLFCHKKYWPFCLSNVDNVNIEDLYGNLNKIDTIIWTMYVYQKNSVMFRSLYNRIITYISERKIIIKGVK